MFPVCAVDSEIQTGSLFCQTRGSRLGRGAEFWLGAKLGSHLCPLLVLSVVPGRVTLYHDRPRHC